MINKKDLPLDVSIDKDSHITEVDEAISLINEKDLHLDTSIDKYITEEDKIAIFEQERFIDELTQSFDETVRKMLDEDYEMMPRKCGHPAQEEYIW